MTSSTSPAATARTSAEATVGIPTAVVAVAARLDSSRLPGKALMDLGGLPVVGNVLARAARVDGPQAVVLATTDRPVDAPLAAYALSVDIPSFRGSVDDVAQRLLDCARQREADYIVRVNGDSPFIDPELIARGLAMCRERDLDFCTNIPGRTFPYGIAVEIVRTATLAALMDGNDEASDREHVTPAIYRVLDTLNHAVLTSDQPELAKARLVVDTAEDLSTCRAVAAMLGRDAISAGYEQTAKTNLDLCRHAAKECA